eukprot:2578236-Rhodomonas_salina.1
MMIALTTLALVSGLLVAFLPDPWIGSKGAEFNILLTQNGSIGVMMTATPHISTDNITLSNLHCVVEASVSAKQEFNLLSLVIEGEYKILLRCAPSQR